MSPALFIIGAEVLSRMFNQLLSNDLFQGFSMHRAGLQITHLAYADDVMIFTSRSKNSLDLIMKQLKNNVKCSGQSINCAKSCFLVSPNAESSHINEIKEITGFKHITSLSLI